MYLYLHAKNVPGGHNVGQIELIWPWCKQRQHQQGEGGVGRIAKTRLWSEWWQLVYNCTIFCNILLFSTIFYHNVPVCFTNSHKLWWFSVLGRNIIMTPPPALVCHGLGVEELGQNQSDSEPGSGALASLRPQQQVAYLTHCCAIFLCCLGGEKWNIYDWSSWATN